MSIAFSPLLSDVFASGKAFLVVVVVVGFRFWQFGEICTFNYIIWLRGVIMKYF